MTLSKSKAFPAELQEVALLAKVLSHPARLSILRYLAEQQECMSGDLAEHLPLSRTTVSQHLQELKKYGLIKGTISGVRVNYCIERQRWQEVQRLMQGFMEAIGQLINECSLNDSACSDEEACC